MVCLTNRLLLTLSHQRFAAMTTPYFELQTTIQQLPSAFKYRSVCRSKDVTRNIKNYSIDKIKEIREVLEKDNESFQELYKYHKAISYQCEKVIEKQLENIRADKKMKDVYTHLKNRYEVALKSKSCLFDSIVDRGSRVSSVAGEHLYKFIITYQTHKCNYTNNFHIYIGETKNELHRIKMIVDAFENMSTPSCSDEEDSVDSGKKEVPQEDEKLTDLKSVISNLDLGDEEW